MIFKKLFYLLNDLSFKIDEIVHTSHDTSSKKVYSITFHSIHEAKDDKKLSNYLNPKSSISKKKLEEFIEFFLKIDVKFINSKDLRDNNLSNINIMLTFDDGYFNNYLLIDIVDKYDIPVEIFISTQYVEQEKLFWWDVIYNCNKDPEFYKNMIHGEILKLSENNFKPKMFSDINRPFTVTELIEVSKNKNILIGNHTDSHMICNNINITEFIDDVSLAQAKLSNWLEYNPYSFAFPNGESKDSVYKKLSNLGLNYNFGLYPNYFLEKELKKKYFLPRFLISPENDLINHFTSFINGKVTLSLHQFVNRFKKKDILNI